MSYIGLKGIKKSFGEHQVLKDVTLSIEKGEFVTFLGPSGCGKTTLLRSLVGLETIDSGSICLDGNDITYVPANRRGIHMIFQQYCLFPTMTVFDNVSFGLRMKSLPRVEIGRAVRNVLEMVDLLGHEKKYSYQLSGGEQQRTALARCLIMNPKVLLLDEPFSAIDAKLRKELQLYLKKIHKELNMTSIFVTHDQEEAMRISDTVHLFNQGILEQSGKPGEVYAQPRTAFVTGFIGSYNQVEAGDFARITGADDPSGRMMAVRPEVIQMASAPFESGDNYYYTAGTVVEYIHQGNVIRYAVAVDGVTLQVDVIFDSSREWTFGQEVYLRIPREYVLSFSESPGGLADE